MIVESGLPELPFVGLPIFITGELFEGVNEFYQVAGVCRAFGDEVKMVGHQAVRVERKCVLSGDFDEFI